MSYKFIGTKEILPSLEEPKSQSLLPCHSKLTPSAQPSQKAQNSFKQNLGKQNPNRFTLDYNGTGHQGLRPRNLQNFKPTPLDLDRLECPSNKLDYELLNGEGFMMPLSPLF